MNRRLYGMLSKRLDEAGLDDVPDERDDRGKRWQLGTLLRAALGAMLAGAQSLAEVETLSERLSRPMRRLLGIQRRLPDTTLRSALCTVEPGALRKPLHALVRKAQRRKALEPDELPFGVVSLDGKGFSIPSSDDWGVETSHQILDTAFAEDDHPWIEANPRAALLVALLRRIAYTLLALFRSVTQRSDERRAVPWKTLMSELAFAFVTTTDDELRLLRPPRLG